MKNRLKWRNLKFNIATFLVIVTTCCAETLPFVAAVYEYSPISKNATNRREAANLMMINMDAYEVQFLFLWRFVNLRL